MPPKKKGDSAEKKAKAPPTTPAAGAAPGPPPTTPAPSAAPPATPDTDEQKRNQEVSRRAMFSLIRAFAKVVKRDRPLGDLEKGHLDTMGNKKRLAILWMLALWHDKQPPVAADLTKQRAKATERKDAETEYLSPTGNPQELDTYYGASRAEKRAGAKGSAELTRSSGFAKAMSNVLGVQITADELRETAKETTLHKKDGTPYQRLTGIDKAKLENLLNRKDVNLEDFGNKMFGKVFKAFPDIASAAAGLPSSGGTGGKKTAHLGQAERTPAATGDAGGSGGAARDSKGKGKPAAVLTSQAKEDEAGPSRRSYVGGILEYAFNAVVGNRSPPAADAKGKGKAGAAAPAASSAAPPPPADAKGKGKAGAAAAGAAAAASAAPPADPKGKGKAKAAPPTPAGAESPESEAQSSGGRRTRSSSKASPAEKASPDGAGSARLATEPATGDTSDPDDFSVQLDGQQFPDVEDLHFSSSAELAAAMGLLPDDPDMEEMFDFAGALFQGLSAAASAEVYPDDDDLDDDLDLSSLNISGSGI